MLQINPKKFKKIQNKTIPSPLRPKFRNKSESNMYFLSNQKNKGQIVLKTIIILSLVILIGLFYLFTI